VIDKEHATGFADGHESEATVTYRVDEGSIASAQIAS
jgi:hypothetical protein